MLTAKPDLETLQFDDATTFLDETGSGDERISQQADSNQVDAIEALMDGALALKEMSDELALKVARLHKIV